MKWRSKGKASRRRRHGRRRPGSGRLHAVLELRQQPAIIGRGSYRDAPRLHRLGQLALQGDAQQAILEARGLHLHEIGKLEAPLEGAGGDTAVQIAVLVGGRFAGLASADEQLVRLGRDLDLVRPETGDGKRDPIAVLADPLEIIGRVIVPLVEAVAGFQKIEQAVEGRAALGRRG